MIKNKNNRAMEAYHRGYIIILGFYRNIIEVLVTFSFGQKPFQIS